MYSFSNPMLHKAACTNQAVAENKPDSILLLLHSLSRYTEKNAFMNLVDFSGHT